MITEKIALAEHHKEIEAATETREKAIYESVEKIRLAWDEYDRALEESKSKYRKLLQDSFDIVYR